MWNTQHTFSNITNAFKSDTEWQWLSTKFNDELSSSMLDLSFAKKCLAYDILAQGKVAQLAGGKVLNEKVVQNTVSLDKTAQLTTQQLGDHYYRILQQFLVQEEEQLFLDAMHVQADQQGSLIEYNYGKFTFDTFIAMKNSVRNPANCLIAKPVLDTLSLDSRFISNFQVSKPAYLAKYGYLGDFDGMSMYTDALRHPDLRYSPSFFKTNRPLLEEDEIYIFAHPFDVGVIFQRAFIETVPGTLPSAHNITCSWYCSEIKCMGFLNTPGTVSKGISKRIQLGNSNSKPTNLPNYIQTEG